MRSVVLGSACASSWLCILLCSAACSEAVDPYATDASSTETEEDSTPSMDGGPASSKDVSSQPRADASIVINEVSGDEEWVELYNLTSRPIDLSGFKVADRDKDTGGPKKTEALSIPDGTVLPANAYGIVAGGAPADGAAATCPAGDQTFCFSAIWGISNKNGETLFLLAPNDTVLDEVAYPANAAPKGSSWSRSPNGTGDFVVAASTPGRSNGL